MVSIELVKWDSDHFGMKVGCVNYIPETNLDALRRQAASEGYGVLFLRSSKNQEQLSILFHDEKIVYTQPHDSIEDYHNDAIKSYKNHLLTDELYDVAIQSGVFSRYNLDKRFPRSCFELLYRSWIENSVKTDYATDVLVYEIDGHIAGLLTYKVENNHSDIGIIAVSKEYRGKNIGSELIKEYKSLLPKYVTKLSVVTQGCNKAACKFYEKNNYSVSQISYIYHLWI